MEKEKVNLALKISVDTTELDKAIEKAKELLDTLEKCGQVTPKNG